MKRQSFTLDELQDRINYRFNDLRLLETATTHSSYVKETKDSGESNERLEFLGDAFLDAIVGQELFESFPSKEEGFLSKMRAAIVCEDGLANEAERLEIGEFLKFGKGEEKNGGRRRRSILADALEAIIGAVYLDGGFDQVRRVVLELFADAIGRVEAGEYQRDDYKTALQERLQQNGTADIRYIVIGEEGPDHDKTFTVQLVVSGRPMTTGEGKSKKKAEQQAAKNMMENLDAF
ncbi:MAG: ribonuclease III [Firmicutes bacterium]|nr:ribonuclease III [Bacillota bacterium]